MAEEIACENGRISNFQGLLTLTSTLDRFILHTIMHQSSTSTYIPSFIEIEETVFGRTDVPTDGRTNGQTDGRTDKRTFETGFIRSTLTWQ